MSVAPKSAFSAKRLAFRKSVVSLIEPEKKGKGGSSQNSSRYIEKQDNHKKQSITRRSRRINDQTVKILPQSESIPPWLRKSIALQQRSTFVTFLLVGAVLLVYGSTVYAQQLWSKEYRKLEILQRKERQLTTAGEILKNKLAQGAEHPDNGLVSPTPDNNLFLVPSPRSTATEKTAPKPSSPKLTPTPVGY
ncbi:hypothetical protein [Argonema antarcticum]|uniref:hypothetical protein n=1 Tax=Argonema antarcticum TaxID=2942763 RepID=UPI002011E92E|nr:hypothetical protein [Argonema antarcticum]MCL1471504.1 hypothetical protein [Argonema antarcticum A004/B2]